MSDVLFLRLLELAQELPRFTCGVTVLRQPVDQGSLARDDRFAFPNMALCHFQLGLAQHLATLNWSKPACYFVTDISDFKRVLVAKA
ncbi:hypothetical protein, partial [Mesorhizobium sp. M3A.F.Ca.ET.201.01.1.1]|uniref:hypothetical protein n=1 Tax=Mesorhizobium sp. M3A.F.Ca.ET.201.01.1.1 TaxID=2563946 RepID=UPI00167A8595